MCEQTYVPGSLAELAELRERESARLKRGVSVKDIAPIYRQKRRRRKGGLTFAEWQALPKLPPRLKGNL